MICDICEREVDYIYTMDVLNVALVGKELKLIGCRTCLENVNMKVIQPNRLRVAQLTSKS